MVETADTPIRPGVEITDRGPFIATHSGTKFYFMDPRPDEVFLSDIAVALGNICRFGGHTDRFYSVAEHCVRMSRLLDWDHHLAVWALMHDAAEAYIGDLPSPIKQVLPEFAKIEAKILRAVSHQFDLGGTQIPQVVKHLDAAICVSEYDALLENSRDPWPNMPPPARGVDLTNAEGVLFYDWGWEFMARAKALGLSDTTPVAVAA